MRAEIQRLRRPKLPFLEVGVDRGPEEGHSKEETGVLLDRWRYPHCGVHIEKGPWLEIKHVRHEVSVVIGLVVIGLSLNPTQLQADSD